MEDGGAVASFAPREVIRHVSKHGTVASSTHAVLPATLLFADISGFSGLAEELSREGPEGLELLSDSLNTAFSRLLRIVQEHGGDVIKFAGDALMVLWPHREVSRSEAAVLATACARSCVEALDMFSTAVQTASSLPRAAMLSSTSRRRSKASFSDVLATPRSSGRAVGTPPPAAPSPPPSRRFTLHCAVVEGEVAGILCGGVDNRWEYVVAGAAVMQDLALCLQAASSGEVIVSPTINSFINAAGGNTQSLDEGRIFRVLGLPATDSLHRTQKSLVSLDIYSSSVSDHNTTKMTELDYLLAPFVPPVVVTRIESGLSGWLAEVRTCSILFVSITDLSMDMEAMDVEVERLQRALASVQRVLVTWEGTLRQAIQDDKGVVVIGAFGLPPLLHEDDASRAVSAAIEIHTALKDIGERCSVGVTTGKVFVGFLGDSRRREFAVVGSVVNLAARLMSSQRDAVVADLPTVHLARGAAQFEAMPDLAVKGKDEPVKVFRVVRSIEGNPSAESGPLRGQATWTCVGRDGAKQTITKTLTAAKAGSPQVLILSGERGIGKTALVDFTARLAGTMRVHTAIGDVQPDSDPLAVWGQILPDLLRTCVGAWQDTDQEYHEALVLYLEQAFEAHAAHVRRAPSRIPSLGSLSNRDAQSDTISEAQQLIAGQGGPRRWMRMLPLVASLVPELGHLPVPNFLREDAQLRSENLVALIVHILVSMSLFESADGVAAVGVVVENIQHLDSVSWRVAEELARNAHSRLFLLLTAGQAVGEGVDMIRLAKLERLRRTTIYRIPSFSVSEASALLCERLEVDSVAHAVAEVVTRRANGNPFFMLEIAEWALSSDRLAATQGRLVAADGVDLDREEIPNTFEVAVAGRLDRLPAQTQLVLKVASAIGPVFPLALLHKIFPIKDTSIESLADVLAATNTLGITEPVIAGSRPGFRLSISKMSALAHAPLKTGPLPSQHGFRQAIVATVAHSLLLGSQRRELHRAIAIELEASPNASLADLARHWLEAADPDKAFQYLVKRGLEATEVSAHREVIAHLSAALDLVPQLGEQPDRIQLGHILCTLGTSRLSVAESDLGFETVIQGFRMLGLHTPTTPMGHIWALLRVIPTARRIVRMSRGRNDEFIPYKAGPLMVPSKIPVERQDIIPMVRQALARAGQAVMFKSEMLGVILYMLQSFLLSSQISELTPSVAMSTMEIAFLCSSAHLEVHHRLRDRAWSLLAQTGDAADAVRPAIHITAALYAICGGDVKASTEAFAEASEYSVVAGDARRELESLSLHGISCGLEGNLEMARRSLLLMEQRLTDVEDQQAQVWVVTTGGSVFLRYGARYMDPERFAEKIPATMDLMRDHADKLQEIDKAALLMIDTVVNLDMDKLSAMWERYTKVFVSVASTALPFLAFAMGTLRILSRQPERPRETDKILKATISMLKRHANLELLRMVLFRVEAVIDHFYGRPRKRVVAKLVKAFNVARKCGSDADLHIIVHTLNGLGALSEANQLVSEGGPELEATLQNLDGVIDYDPAFFPYYV